MFVLWRIRSGETGDLAIITTVLYQYKVCLIMHHDYKLVMLSIVLLLYNPYLLTYSLPWLASVFFYTVWDSYSLQDLQLTKKDSLSWLRDAYSESYSYCPKNSSYINFWRECDLSDLSGLSIRNSQNRDLIAHSVNERHWLGSRFQITQSMKKLYTHWVSDLGNNLSNWKTERVMILSNVLDNLL